jgi:hypothetical protein
MHSNEEDVKKILGSPTKGNIDSYLLKDVSVIFRYSRGACKEGWNVKKGVIINITIIPYDKPKLSDLALDMNLFSIERYGHLPDMLHYVNRKEGVSYAVLDDMVTQIIYSPSEEDEQRRCKIKRAVPKN